MSKSDNRLSRSRRNVKATFLDRLVARQREMGLTDGEFACELGVQRVLWQKTRSRQCAVGLKVLAGAVRRFPDLGESVLEFLKEIGASVAARRQPRRTTR